MKIYTIKRLLSISCLVCSSIFAYAQLPYQNKLLTHEVRAEDLLNRLTLEEKVGLMMNDSKAIPRLGIKRYEWWNEALHGIARNGTATVFPQTIGMAASFDTELLYKVFTTVSDEARVKNRQAVEKGVINRYQGLTVWTPNINIFRDPRWGRGQETYGEDPYLTSKMGVAVITGLQGDGQGPYDKLHACAKHFAVHSGPEWSRHYFDADNIAPRDLWETYLPAFKAAVQKGNVKEVMCAYNSFEGQPCCGSNRLLTQILRDQWGYNGIVVSDCGAINDFYKPNTHNTEPDSSHASSTAVMSGTDLECGSSYKSIVGAVGQGLISDEIINKSVKRLLIARFELGEMDTSTPWDKLPDSLVNCTANHKLSLKMAQESMVLLKNDGILPLGKHTKIALIGPNANDSVMLWANYNGTPKKTTTLLEAMKNRIPGLVYTESCPHTYQTANLFPECQSNGKAGISATYWNNTDMTGSPAAHAQYNEALKFTKLKPFARGVNANMFSSKFSTTFTPTVDGDVEIIYTAPAKITLYVEGKEANPEGLTKTLYLKKLQVKAGKSYAIAFDLVRTVEIGEFRFTIQRNVAPDVNKILNDLKKTDVVVFAGGISANYEREDANVYAPGFKGGDRTSIELPQVQRDLIATLKAAGKKVVLVNFSGSAMGLVPESKNCDAIIQAWYPGEAGGEAATNVLFGKYNPSGRLPVTFYRNAEQLPPFENYDMKGRTYRYLNAEPLYPFGYGLSFTTFNYGKPHLDRNVITAGDSVRLTVPVTNTGKLDGDEVVQVYLKKTNDANGPVKTLRAFKRVTVQAGKTATVSFELNGESLEWWDAATNTIHPLAGKYLLTVGGSSREKDLTTLHLQIN
ncbi:MAG: glycoside hydrolase family 3 C-terminal domain-containing protein [Paludibacter sp.]|nr:glycoside hydrolase family 3 C-terminal domain-containing protein [Paludibacter sp.]